MSQKITSNFRSAVELRLDSTQITEVCCYFTISEAVFLLVISAEKNLNPVTNDLDESC